jgi:hypothetical protein
MISSIRQMLAQGAPASLRRFSQASHPHFASILDDRAQCRFVLRALEPIAETRVIQHVGTTDRGHQRLILAVVVHREEQKLSLARNRLAVTLRLIAWLPNCFLAVAGDGEVGDLGGEERQAGLEHRHVDVVPTGMRALKQADDTAKAAVMPDSTSHTAKPARRAHLLWPVSDMMPDSAWILPS